MKNEKIKKIKNSGAGELLGVFGALVALFLLLSLLPQTSSKFLTSNNLFNVARQITVNIILCCGLTMAILIGGIDLSVGSIIAITGCLVSGLITNNEMPVGLAIIISLIVGVIFGALNGLVISLTNIPPFIVTLATMDIGRGIVRLYTDCDTILVKNPVFSFIGKGKLWDVVPIQVIYIIVICAIAWFVLNRTKFGRHIYAVGDNELAAVYTGINVKKTKFFVYVLVGLFAAIAGILTAARTGSGLFSAGEGYEMDAIAAVVLGGTSMTGGVGRLSGSILGAIIIGILSNGMNLLGFNSSWQYIIKGIVLLIAVLIDYLKKRNDS
ncbi:MAG: ABC transporter permease [Candidatus Limivicinus sp.]|nr:ABC transporter permease [Candidatus Limivicinus sp.]